MVSGGRHHARRRRRRGGDSVRTSRALRSDAVRTGRSISLNTLITAATLNIWRYEKNVILKTNSTQNINFIHILLIHDISKTETVPIHPDPTFKIPAVYILHTFANEHWGIFCQNLAVRQFFLDFLSTNVISATWVTAHFLLVWVNEMKMYIVWHKYINYWRYLRYGVEGRKGTEMGSYKRGIRLWRV